MVPWARKPTCACWHDDVPVTGAMWVLHRQPGGYITRLMRASPACSSSTVNPPTSVRVALGMACSRPLMAVIIIPNQRADKQERLRTTGEDAIGGDRRGGRPDGGA